MKSTALCFAVAGLATGAMAEEFSLSIVGPTTVEQGSVFTIEITGDSTFGTHIYSAAYGLMTNSGLIESLVWIPASWSVFNDDGGYSGNGNYGEVSVGQFFGGIPGEQIPAEGSEVGGMIGSFQVVLAATGTGVIDFSILAGTPFTLETFYVVDFTNEYDTDGTLTLNGLSVNVVPTPSSAVMLALGGLVATRRRRV